MSVTRTVAVVEDPRFRAHRGPAGHPERPDRLLAVGEAIEEVRPRLQPLAPRPALDEEILRIHGRSHLDGVTAAVARAPAQLDADTYVSPESLEVARLAAGSTVELVRAVARGEAHSGLAAVRPPGHHAEAGHAMGFCLFNNVAIAARALQAEEGVERVLILDWDVHHGNGTQHSFDDDPSVLYFSTHQFPYYPGTGDFGEAGSGRGAGATVNVPLPAGCGDSEYVGALQRILVPVVEGFRPDVMLVSAGFDAHAVDPLASMDVTGEGFAGMAAIVRAVADSVCGGRLAFVLEGGYAAVGLREGVRAVLAAATSDSPPDLPAPVEAPEGSMLHHVVERTRAVHAGRFPGLGAA